jgi:hypothetical protein
MNVKTKRPPQGGLCVGISSVRNERRDEENDRDTAAEAPLQKINCDRMAPWEVTKPKFDGH